MRRQIELSNDAAKALAGEQDAVLRALEESVNCGLFLRGNLLTLDGEDAAVEGAAVVVKELVDLIDQGHEIAPGTIAAVTGALENDASPAAILEDVVWRHRSTRVAPKTVNQKRYVDSIRRNTITFGVGPAGTGKTFLAVALAAAALSRREVNRIILTRPAVEAGERLGFLPGDLMAKIDPYLRPLFDALHDMLEAEKVAAFLERGQIEVAPLAFMRGRAQPVDEPVLTPAGWQPIGTLRVGDLVIGSEGRPTPVLGVFPQGRRPVFRFVAADGGWTRCCAEHLWTVRPPGGDWQTVQTREVRVGSEFPLLRVPATSTVSSEGAPAPSRRDSAVALAPERRFLGGVEPAGQAETVCIQVAAQDSLYVTRDHLLTHNTLNDSFIILDEAQNTTPEQMKMILTRLGFNSRMVVTGDITQIDLPKNDRSGLVVVGEILEGIEGIDFVRFGGEDVVRHRLVQRIVEAYAEHGERAASTPFGRGSTSSDRRRA